MYRVNWRKGIPYIEIGEIRIVGKKGIRKIKWPSEEKLLHISSGSEKIKEAIVEEIYVVSNNYGRYAIFEDNKNKDAWLLMSCIIRIRRLYRKLKKHHLI
jgi:hypothetical protein